LAFKQTAKLRLQMRRQSNVAQVSHEKAQTTAVSQAVAGNFNPINNIFVFGVLLLLHCFFHLLGLKFGAVTLGSATVMYLLFPLFGWVFLLKITHIR